MIGFELLFIKAKLRCFVVSKSNSSNLRNCAIQSITLRSPALVQNIPVNNRPSRGRINISSRLVVKQNFDRPPSPVVKLYTFTVPSRRETIHLPPRSGGSFYTHCPVPSHPAISSSIRIYRPVPP